jgi:hypothetical protein
VLRNLVLDVDIAGQFLVGQIVSGVGLELDTSIVVSASSGLNLDQTVI